MSKDFEEWFEFLNRHEVRYLVIGAHAVAFHAKPRFTKDLDVLVEPSAENGERLLRALDEFGFGSLDIQVDDFTRPGRVVQLGIPPTRIDLVTSIDGVSFEQAWSGRVAGRFGDQKVHYLGRAELIENKRRAGRPQDLLDVSLLQDESEG